MKKITLSIIVLFLLLSGIGNTQEITEAPTFAELLQSVESSLLKVEDFIATVKIEYIENNRTNSTLVKVQASQTHGIARLEFIEPNVLAGQIIVANNNTNEVSLFMPVVQQIIISPLETVGLDLGLGFDLTDLNSIFDFSTVTGTIEEIVDTKEAFYYLVKLSGFEQNQIQYVWINQEFIPYKVAIYEGEKYLGNLVLENLLINQGLTADKLQDLPKVTRVRF